MAIKKMLNIAINECKKKIDIEGLSTSQHAAVVFRGTRVLGVGTNTNNRTRYFGCSYLPGAHAEVSALYKAYGKKMDGILHKWISDTGGHNHSCQRGIRYRGIGIKGLNKTSIVVIRLKSGDILSRSDCCCLCISVMKAVGIGKVYYSNDRGELESKKVDIMKPTFVSSGTAQIYIQYRDHNNIIKMLIPEKFVDNRLEKDKRESRERRERRERREWREGKQRTGKFSKNTIGSLFS